MLKYMQAVLSDGLKYPLSVPLECPALKGNKLKHYVS